MKTNRLIAPSVILLTAFLVSFSASAGIKNTSARTKQIDQLVDALHTKQELKANSPISDEQFLRRIYLVAGGRIPTAAETESFMQDKSKDKRDKLIDQLLESEAYVSHFYNYWADVLRINRRLGRSGASNEYAYKHWVKDSLRNNKPYDQMVNELVSSDGDVWDNGATGYYQRDRGMPLDNMANTVRIFLGTRLECAQCHDHPFDDWSQMDFFKMASFTFGTKAGYNKGGTQNEVRTQMSRDRKKFLMDKAFEISGIKGFYPTRKDADITKIYANDDRKSMARRRGIKTEEEYRALNNKVLKELSKYDNDNRITSRLISDIYDPLKYSHVVTNDKKSQLPHDYQYDDAKPKQSIEPGTMFGNEIPQHKLDEGYSTAYADWMTSKENPTFTKVIANRLWKQAFGVGLVEPVDQLTSHSEPSSPELMDYLEQCMKDLDYDMKSYLSMIYKSDAWQREAHTEEIAAGKPFYFQGPAPQRMSAEQIWDSLAVLTIPNVDAYQPTYQKEVQSIERERNIANALAKHSPEKFRGIVEQLGAEVRDNYQRQEAIRINFQKAREAEDIEKIKRYSGELKQLRSSMQKRISQVAYEGADARYKNSKKGSMNMMSDTAEMGDMQRTIRIAAPDTKITPPKGLSKTQLRQWRKDQSRNASGWKNIVKSTMRASELPTPAPRGHFLREFGQSDRELIQNANDAASVPQALSLMNSNLASTLRHPYSILGQALSSCETPEQEINTMYKLMFTRQPTKGEKSRLMSVYESNPREARNNIIWALLNTQQFIFVN